MLFSLSVVVRGRGGGADVDAGDLVAVELAVLPARLPGGQDENRAAPDGLGEVHLKFGVHVRHPVRRQLTSTFQWVIGADSSAHA